MRRDASFALVGDVGGTNARFAVADLQGARPSIVLTGAVLCKDHESLAAAADASTEESSPVDMIDATQFAEMCAALERRLATDDFCSMQLLEQNAALFKAALGEHYASIVAAVEEFDFATALDHLKQATSAEPPRGD